MAETEHETDEGTIRSTEPAGFEQPECGSAAEVLLVALRLGLTSFGGPIAHLGYFHQEYVERRRWLDESSYADLVALCQLLPGPASSEVGIAVGITRAGLLGGLAAWLGFTLPSALLLLGFAVVVQHIGPGDTAWLHALQVVAVAVVAQAVWSMARTLAPDRARGSIAVIAALIALTSSTPLVQVGVIVAARLIGLRLPRGEALTPPPALPLSIGRRTAIGAWVLLFGLLVFLPLARHLAPNQPLALFDSFFRTGSLVFGGGHVVQPLLQAAVVPPGWVSNTRFITGYGAAQAVPGPLFTFSAYLGAIERPAPNGPLGAAIALVAIFLPAFLLVTGSLPFWSVLRGRPGFRAALRGVNAAVVGLLLAALYRPIWTTAIHTPADFGLALAAFGLLILWRAPPWLVVLITALAGALLHAV